MELPFLVVHGAWVWKVLLVALIAMTYAATWGLRVRRARRQARREVAGRLEKATAPALGEATVAGTLRGGTLSRLTYFRAHHHHASGALWVDCGGVRVELPDDIELVRGSHEHRALRPPAGTPNDLVEHSRATVRPVDGGSSDYSLQTISDGDEVTISGMLAPRAGDAASYRDSDVTWTLGGNATIASVAPRGVPMRHHPAIHAVFAAVVAFGWYGVLYKVGQLALDRSRTNDRVGTVFTPERLASARWLQIASAMPRSREKALFALDFAASEGRERSERGLRFAEAVDALVGHTCDVKRRAMEDLRWEDALATARACGDAATELSALIYLGEHALAAAHPATGRYVELDVTVAIAAGQWKRAAEHAEQLAREREANTDAKQAAQIRCMATLFRHHAGERPPPAASSEPLCDIVRALQGPEDQRLPELDALEIEDAGLRIMKEMLVRVHGGKQPRLYLGAPVTEAITSGHRVPWLARFATDEHAALERFALQLLVDPTKLADYDAIPLSREQQMYDYSNRLAIALVSGAPLPPEVPLDLDKRQGYVHPSLVRMLAIRRGEPMPDFILSIYPDTCEARFGEAVAAAQRGEGAPLASTLRDCTITGGHLHQLLLAVLPLVKTDRAALAESLRFLRDRTSTYDYPFGLILTSARRRDIARLVSDRESQERWQRTVDRLVAPLADRDRSIALHLWVNRD